MFCFLMPRRIWRGKSFYGRGRIRFAGVCAVPRIVGCLAAARTMMHRIMLIQSYFFKPAPRLVLDFINRHRRSLLARVTGTRQRIEAEPPSVHPFLYGVSYGNYLLPYCLFLFIGQFDTYSCILFMYIMSNSIGFSKKCLKKTLLQCFLML